MKYCLAIDLGASSGRHIVGYKDNNEIITEEVYRFENGVKQIDGHLTWDIDYLFNEVKKGIKIAFSKYQIKSLSIDTWGVDYVLMKDDEVVYPVYAYRDNRTLDIIDEVHSKISFEELYKRTGCQFQTFTSIYQMYDDLKNKRFEGVSDHLMIPEYLLYKLTGVKVNEFTDATTTGLVNIDTLEFDYEIIDKLGLPRKAFRKLEAPKCILGKLKDDIAIEVNGNCDVILCATHDTGSAVEGIPMVGNELYISSGTWCLLGVKTEKAITDLGSLRANYSNEGGVGYNRYQKNIMGLWVVNELRRNLCPDLDFKSITELANKSTFEETVDINQQDFLAPSSMKDVFDKYLNSKPKQIGDYFRCAYKSLALSFDQAIKELEANTNKTYKDLYIVGGGAKNDVLINFTKQYTNKNVIALPIEATSLGNLKIQMEVI